jgi:hypothetical protein
MNYEYWVVTENRTGRIICQCGDMNDAIMMVSLDPDKRSYSQKRFILDQVVDVTWTTDKQLTGQLGLPEGITYQLNQNTQEAVIV